MRARTVRNLLAAAGLAVAAATFTAGAAAAVPATVTHQGRLFDVNGNPLNTTVSVAFAIYDGPGAGANQLWTETYSLALDEGYYSVELGSMTPFGAGVFDGSTRYFGITVGADAEMSPRIEMVSVPYALVAGDAIGDIHPTSVTINGQLVINSSGQWVGSPTGLQGPQGPQGPDGAIGPQGPEGPQGPVGAVGPTGPQGAQGVAGATGPQGAQGVAGATGPQGVAGTNGTNGALGATGPTGAAGTNGAAGATGAVGPTGAVGATGAAGTNGTNGAAGATGAVGPTGPQGAAGTNGAAGATGAVGPTGAAGTNGATGAVGPTGAAGATGAVGPTGAAGTNGTNGAAGATGAVGPAGAAGATGAAGTNGTNGANGAVGPTGPAGANGANGANGAVGPTGPQGPQGAQGAQGTQGAQGVQGPVGPTGPGNIIGGFDMQYSQDDRSSWTHVESLGDDTCFTAIPLGFTFSAFGATTSQIGISSNGVIFFDPSTCSTAFFNTALPSSITSVPMLFFFWDDLDDYGSGEYFEYHTEGDTAGGHVFWLYFTNRFLADSSNSTNRVNAMIGIYESGMVTVSHSGFGGYVNAQGGSATFGMQTSGGSSAHAFEVSVDSRILDDNASRQSMSFHPPK